MVPSSPALVMLGLVAGAHGGQVSLAPQGVGPPDGKDAFFLVGLGRGDGISHQERPMANTPPDLLNPREASPLSTRSKETSGIPTCLLQCCRVGRCECDPVYGLKVRRAQDLCGHRRCAQGGYCVHCCGPVQKAQCGLYQGMVWESGLHTRNMCGCV